MDSFDFDGVADENNKAISAATRWYNRFTSLAKLFRFAELCSALVLLSWFCTRLPLAVEVSGDYFRQFSGVFTSPLFVFVLCHVIVVSIMANSGQFSRRSQRRGKDDAEAELYDKMVKNCSDRTIKSPSENDNASGEADDAVYEDKGVISEVNTTTAIKGDRQTKEDPDCDFPDSDSQSVYRRWQSEKFEPREHFESNREELRRSESEKCLDIVVSSHERHQAYPHDKLSDDDFNRTVEDFIAKQLKFRRQEHVFRAVSHYYQDMGHDHSEASPLRASYARLATTING